MMTVPDVAQALQISRSKVYELIQQNDLKTVKIGRLRRIETRALYDYIRSLEMGG
jgi:excisionase family DNA binding protein